MYKNISFRKVGISILLICLVMSSGCTGNIVYHTVTEIKCEDWLIKNTFNNSWSDLGILYHFFNAEFHTGFITIDGEEFSGFIILEIKGAYYVGPGDIMFFAYEKIRIGIKAVEGGFCTYYTPFGPFSVPCLYDSKVEILHREYASESQVKYNIDKWLREVEDELRQKYPNQTLLPVKAWFNPGEIVFIAEY